MELIHLSDGEWKIMKTLWDSAPKTIMQITKELSAETGWSKHTVITMLHRMEKKQAVCCKTGGKAKQYMPIIAKEDISLEETRGFLNKVYQGSLSLLIHTMASSQAISKQEIEELYAILKRAEEDSNG